MDGWIKLHRQIIENELYFSERFTKSQAWIDLLLLARHDSGLVTIRGIDIRLNPGQLCWSQLSFAKRWGWDRKTVKKFLNLLKKREMVDIKISKVTTIISIISWLNYQGSGQQNGQQKDNKTDTNNKVKNVIEELALSLIESIKKESSFYAIINKYISALGEDKLFSIMTDCHKRENTFANENKLAAYLGTCTRNNGKLTDHIPFIEKQVPGWM